MDRLDLIHAAINAVSSDMKEIGEKVATIDKNVALNTASLDEHIKRTELAEARLDNVEKQMSAFHTSLTTAFKIGSLTASGMAAVYALRESHIWPFVFDSLKSFFQR